ncbi:MAG: type II secretion system minor pseudopilin GspI [Pseudomonadota bacterium]
MASRRSRAFTLIEVMFALAIVATGIAALTAAGVNFSSNANYLRDKTFARWVASDKLIEMRVTRAWPDLGKDEGQWEMAGQTWHWRVETEAVQDPLLRQVTIQVRLNPSASGALSTLTAFLGDPGLVLEP